MIKKIFNLYKNKYIKFFVFVIFLVFLYNSHFKLKYTKSSDKDSIDNKKFTIVKKIKTVLSKTKNGHASYTKEISYEYETDQNEDKKIAQNNLNNEIAKKILIAKKQKKIEEELQLDEQKKADKVNELMAEYKITVAKKSRNKKNLIKCGDVVKYNLISFLNGRPSSFQTFESIILVGSNFNKDLEKKFIGKQVNDVFEVDMDTFMGDQKKVFKEEQKKMMKDMPKDYSVNYNDLFHNLNIKYRIKITEIIKNNAQAFKCKK